MFVSACTDFSICFEMYLILDVRYFEQYLVRVQANSKDIVYDQRSFYVAQVYFLSLTQNWILGQGEIGCIY